MSNPEKIFLERLSRNVYKPLEDQLAENVMREFNRLFYSAPINGDFGDTFGCTITFIDHQGNELGTLNVPACMPTVETIRILMRGSSRVKVGFFRWGKKTCGNTCMEPVEFAGL